MTVREELERLRNRHGGIITPEQVVDAARPKSSSLHKSFTWNDGEAAHQWRLEQARRLLRVYVTVFNDGKRERETRMFVSLSTDRRNEGGYRAIVDVMGDAALRGQLLNDAKQDMLRFRQKYAVLAELSDVFELMGRHLKIREAGEARLV